MQIWTFLDQARLLANRAYQQALIYDQPDEYLSALLDAQDTLHDQFALPTTDRHYWTIRNALEALLYRTAQYAQDGRHGPDTDPPANPQPTLETFLHQTGTLATAADNPALPYAHYCDFRDDLDEWTTTIAAELAKPPAERTRPTILPTLSAVAIHTALFTCRARLTIHDNDPHEKENYAVHRWEDDSWQLLENHCYPHHLPDPPTAPGDFAGETVCRACLPDYYGYAGSPATPQTAAPFIPIIPFHAPPRHDRAAGIVTATDATNWRTLAATVLFANLHRIPIAIADHGLTDAMRRALRPFRIHWIPDTAPPLPAAMPPHHAIAPPRAWSKPWVCLASPWYRSIWIDADALPIHNIRPALDTTDTRTLLTTNTPWNTSSAYLYHRFLGAYEPRQAPTTDSDPETAINTGVLVWTQDAPEIAMWRDFAAQIIAQPPLAALCGVRDQTAMFATLRYRRIVYGEQPTYLDPTWNTPADNLPAPAAAGRQPLPANPAQLLAVVKARHPNAKIVHWLGRPKPQNLPFTE